MFERTNNRTSVETFLRSDTSLAASNSEDNGCVRCSGLQIVECCASCVLRTVSYCRALMLKRDLIHVHETRRRIIPDDSH